MAMKNAFLHAALSVELYITHRLATARSHGLHAPRLSFIPEPATLAARTDAAGKRIGQAPGDSGLCSAVKSASEGSVNSVEGVQLSTVVHDSIPKPHEQFRSGARVTTPPREHAQEKTGAALQTKRKCRM